MIKRVRNGMRSLFGIVLFSLVGGCALTTEEESASNRVERPLIFPQPPDPPRFVFERTIVSSAQILPQDKDTALRLALTGEGAAGEGLTKPYAIVVHKGRIFVSDTADRVVKVFDVAQGKFFRVGEDGLGQLNKPMGLDIASDGTLFVADIGAKVIMVYNRDGKFLRKLGNAQDFDRLSSLTVDPNGERIYLVDIGGVRSDRHVVKVISARDGQLLQEIGRRGVKEGEFNLPRDSALSKDGRLYVVDGGNFRIQVFDRTGKYLKSFGKVGKQLGDFARPKEVAIDDEGNVYVVDAAFGNFQIFNADGQLLMYIGERSDKGRPAEYMLPSGIAVDEDGRVYVIDQWFRKIDIFRPHGLAADQGNLVFRPVVK